MSTQTLEPDTRFDGVRRLYGDAAWPKIQASRIAIIGIGGVGSWAAEALARTGVGALTLVDLDDVCVSNTNRQLHALDGTIGRPKVEVMAERIRRIHPTCKVNSVSAFFTARTADELLAPGFDIVIDAIDNPKNKVQMILACGERGIPIVVVGGAGGRRDPTEIRHGDLAQSIQDGLLRKVRYILRKEHGFEGGGRIGGHWGIASVFSRERAWFPQPDGTVRQLSTKSAKRIDCSTGYGTAAQVTGAYGFVAAQQAIHLLLGPDLLASVE